MAETDEARIEIGFAGGSGLHVVADRAQWEQLEAALNGKDGAWVTLTGKDDAQYMVAIDKVVYVRVDSVTRSIGFRE